MKQSKIHPRHVIFLLFLLVLLTGCTGQQQTGSSPTEHAAASAVQETEPLQSSQPLTESFEIATDENISNPNNDEVSESGNTNPDTDPDIQENFASLPTGGYILYTDAQGMGVISEDGAFQQRLSDSLQGIPISADGRILSVLNATERYHSGSFINLLLGEIKTSEQLGAISPDLKWIAKTTPCDPEVDQLGIEGFSIKANISFCTYVDELKDINTDKVHELISDVRWAPDASRLAFTKITTAISDEPDSDWSLLLSNALFVTDASCFLDPRTCDPKTKLSVFNPYKVPCNSINEIYLSWSPDGTFVVLNNGQMFVVFDLRNEYAWKLEKPHLDLENAPQYFGISPDNQWIAYSGDFSNILLQPLYKGEPIEIANGLEDVQVLGWIMAPLLESNAAFKVLPDGNHARIYAQPGFDRQHIGSLYDNNTFTVLDGPIQEDGYTWWYIHSDVDGVEGWVTEFYGWYEKVE